MAFLPHSEGSGDEQPTAFLAHTDLRPSPSPVVSDGRPTRGAGSPFATTLRTALRRSGLTLERVRHRLGQQGINVSVSTLSYWQNGRSQPTGDPSLRAVTVLEAILDLPTGALHGQLGSPRPRGRLVPLDPAAFQRTFGQRSPVAQALGGEEFVSLNCDLRPLLTETTVRLDAERTIRTTSTRTVFRAVNSGVNGFTHVSVAEEAFGRLPDIDVRFGILGTVRRLPHLRTSVTEIMFGRRLERSDTALIEYGYRSGPDEGPANQYQHFVRPGVREVLLHVVFHPLALPASCYSYRRSAYYSAESDPHPLPLDTSHSVHTLISRAPAGLHGIAWEWPR